MYIHVVIFDIIYQSLSSEYPIMYTTPSPPPNANLLVEFPKSEA